MITLNRNSAESQRREVGLIHGVICSGKTRKSGIAWGGKGVNMGVVNVNYITLLLSHNHTVSVNNM